MRIQGGSQNYAWGRIGAASWVTRFLNGEICQQSPYAEYWLGTHPSLPSMANGQLLSNITGNLPYLFKVLSIAKPLSIQIHPNKTQAEILHGISKVLYPDNNHKPELCIAKGKMRLFIGFKTMEEISNMLEQTPELLQIVGRDCLSEQLKSLYKNEEETKKQVENYCARMQGGLFCELNQSFPGDIGVFFAMFMNFLELNNTESVVIGPGVPHCYIEGECIEAMACSDNVIRAGLTQKAKDVKTLLEVRQI